MRLRVRIGAGVTTLAVLVTVGASNAVAGTSAQAVEGPRRSSSAPGAPWVTLVTGDRVLVRPNGGGEAGYRVVTARPGPGRAGMTFTTRTERGETFVTPADALRPLAAGLVDPRLFNVSRLIEYSYDDAHRATLPLIVSHPMAAAPRVGVTGDRQPLASVAGSAMDLEKAAAGAFWRAATGGAPAARALAGGISRVWLDGRVTASLDHSVPQTGAPAAWAAGHTGRGATVAVLDSGIDVDHPDLATAVLAAADFTESESGTDDRFGHGTHVAGIITGDGAASGGRYAGMAPDAKLLNGKVLDDFGGGFESGIIAGMEWAVAQGADVVNMSLGGGPSDGTDPLDLAVNELTRSSGTLFVVSAGNFGPESRTVASPGAADEALTVGAVDRDGAIAEFSSRGPRFGDLAVKPDLTAPGVDIVSALAAGSLLGEFEPVVDQRYLRLSGTSMAAPHVAGAAAILAAQHAGWDADEIKPALMGAGRATATQSVYEYGAGQLDVARATAQSVFATTASISIGVVRWPHEDDSPIARTLTYRNDGGGSVTLALKVDVRDPEGQPAPAGMFTLDRTELTVPAGGTATAVLTTNTAVPGRDGRYGGRVTATTASGSVTVHTPVGVVREVESYDVALTFLDHNGEPTDDAFFRFVDIAIPEAVLTEVESGRAVARVPKGRHYFEVLIGAPTEEVPWRLAALVEPELTVAADTSLVLDARAARPTGAALDPRDAANALAVVFFDRATDWGDTGFGIFTSADALLVRPSTTAAPGRFTYSFGGDYARPDGAGTFAGSPYLYHVSWRHDGRVPVDLVRRIRDRDLAIVRNRIAATASDQVVSKDFIVDLRTPARLTERFTPGLTWFPAVFVLGPGEDPFEGGAVIGSEPVVYERGTNVEEQWNLGPFGPSLPTEEGLGGLPAVRFNDTFEITLPLFGDQVVRHWGVAYTDPARLTLLRDGEIVGESDAYYGLFDVPAETHTYRLEARASRLHTSVSTQVSAAWTFRSSRPPADEPRALPLMAVRFAPRLDDHNRAPAGLFAVPLHVQRQAGGAYGSLTRLTVEVSYDDGRTWRRVPVLGGGVDRTALLFHPDGTRFVSLRAKVADRVGNAVEQTIIRAYALR
jgi:subtilisin family serine protease